MHLVFNHVTELKHVDHTYGCRLVETFARAAVVKIGLTVTGQTGLVSPCIQIVECCTVEDRSGEFLTQFATCPSEHGLEDLTEVHT